jgi:deltex-like protein
MFENYHQPISLPGFGSFGTIVIYYRFQKGTQGSDDPNPGKPYTEAITNAYLPDNKEGRKILKLLKKAFQQKLTFTIGQLTTTGMDDCIVWNGIPHKTSRTGGPAKYVFVSLNDDFKLEQVCFVA